MEPRKVVGTVSTSEFLVASAASIGFLVSLDRSLVALPVVAALLAGGMVAAPVAAWLVRFLHPRLLGAAIGGLIVLTNARTIMGAVGVEGDARVAAYVALATFWVIALGTAGRAVRAERRTDVAATPVVASPARPGMGVAD
jgi:hypothetical protein